MTQFRGDWQPGEAKAIALPAGFWQRPSLEIGATMLRGFLSTMAAAAKAAPDAALLEKLVRDNRASLLDLMQGDPAMYGDLADVIGGCKRALSR